MRRLRDFLRGLQKEDVGVAVRRFFVNTVFDSTFMLMGILIGSTLVKNPDASLTLSTMFTSSLALGISSGVSVFEAESLERERRIVRLEKALFRDLDNTIVAKSAREATVLASTVNFLTPLTCCTLVASPMFLVYLGILEILSGVYFSVAVALSILFVTGAYLGRMGKRNPLVKGVRMVAFGVVAFAIGYLLNTLF